MLSTGPQIISSNVSGTSKHQTCPRIAPNLVSHASLSLSTPAPNLGFLPHPYGGVLLHIGDIFCNLLSILSDPFSPKCS